MRADDDAEAAAAPGRALSAPSHGRYQVIHQQAVCDRRDSSRQSSQSWALVISPNAWQIAISFSVALRCLRALSKRTIPLPVR